MSGFGGEPFGIIPFGVDAFNSGNFGVGGASVLKRLQAFSGLTFYKEYVQNQTTVNANFSVGSSTGTMTSARTGSAPSTYYDANGVIINLTTANVPRWTAGYYDGTGWHTKPGLLIEMAISNKALQNTSFANVVWTATNITAADSISNPNGTAPASTVSTLTSTAGNGSLTQAFVDAAAGKYTSSIFIRRKTGTGVINLRANTGDAYTDITSQVLSSWTRVQVTSSSLTNPTFDIQIVTSGDEVYVYGAQLEKNPYMTSWFPITTTARTRPTETLTYPIANNRTAASESIFIKFTALGGTFANDGVQRTLLSSDTKARQLHKANTGTTIRNMPNTTDNAAVVATGTSSPAINTSYIYAATMQHNLPNDYATAYGNGVVEGHYTAGDFTDPAWGTNFQVGAASAGSNQLNGLLESIAIYSSWKTDPDVNHISYVLSPTTVTYHSYLITPTSSSATNLVSGAAGNGNVVTNPANYYLWMDTYACADVAWVGGTNRTGETWYCFTEEGSDAERTSFPTAAPLGNIVMRTYTKSTNTFTDPPVTIWNDATYQANEIRSWRNPNEAFIRIYFSMARRTDGVVVGIYCLKSTDLTASSWSAPALCITTDDGHPWTFVDLADGSHALVLGISGTAYSNKVTLWRTTDYDSFTLYSSITSTGSNNPEGGMVGDGNGKMMLVCRVNAGDYLQQATSSDWGLTWSALSSTGLGAATGAKVKPRLLIAAGMPDRVMVYFYDRGDNRLKIGTPTKFTDAFAGTWLPTYLIGTSAQGNGNFEVVDDTLRRYIVSTQSGAEPTNDFRWCLFKDIYTWVAQ